MKRWASADRVLAGGVLAAVFGLGLMAVHPPTAAARQPATSPAGATTAKGTVPAELVGEWFEGTVGPTTYWDSQTGKYLGSGRQMGSILQVNADGIGDDYQSIAVLTEVTGVSLADLVSAGQIDFWMS